MHSIDRWNINMGCFIESARVHAIVGDVLADKLQVIFCKNNSSTTDRKTDT